MAKRKNPRRDPAGTARPSVRGVNEALVEARALPAVAEAPEDTRLAVERVLCSECGVSTPENEMHGRRCLACAANDAESPETAAADIPLVEPVEDTAPTETEFPSPAEIPLVEPVEADYLVGSLEDENAALRAQIADLKSMLEDTTTAAHDMIAEGGGDVEDPRLASLAFEIEALRTQANTLREHLREERSRSDSYAEGLRFVTKTLAELEVLLGVSVSGEAPGVVTPWMTDLAHEAIAGLPESLDGETLVTAITDTLVTAFARRGAKNEEILGELSAMRHGAGGAFLSLETVVRNMALVFNDQTGTLEDRKDRLEEAWTRVNASADLARTAVVAEIEYLTAEEMKVAQAQRTVAETLRAAEAARQFSLKRPTRTGTAAPPSATPEATDDEDDKDGW